VRISAIAVFVLWVVSGWRQTNGFTPQLRAAIRPAPAHESPEMPSFSSDGLTLNYIDEGEGAPVLLIHGFASNLVMNWVGPQWVQALTRAGYRVVAFDHRGHGESEKVYEVERYTIRDMAKE
jgi:pimeloyl-ACP methyl ester carboxylesterase